MSQNKQLDHSAMWEKMSARPFFDPVRRAIARNYGLRTFPDYCDDHGETEFSAKHGTCVECTTPRSPRAVARKAGLKTYEGVCATHGAVAFGVNSGKCLTCCNAMGVPRPQAPSTNTARAAARREGSRTYMADCATHGLTAHSTGPGKCLTCFNAMGYRRPGQ